MQFTYFGHATFQIETNGTTILVDPFFSDNPHTDVAPEALDPDVILITHAHFDHFSDAPQIATRTGALVIANFEITQYLGQKHGHDNAQPLNEGGTADFDWGSVTATHARHSSSFPDGSYGGVPNGHLLYAEDTCIYNTGDTAPFAEMVWIGDEHDVDLLLMPVGDVFTMGIDGSVHTAEMVDPRLTFPLHYDTFPPLETDLDAWAQAMDEAGFDTQVPAFGETVEL